MRRIVGAGLIGAALGLAACGGSGAEEEEAAAPDVAMGEMQRVDLFDGEGNAVGFVSYQDQGGNLSISIKELGLATGTHAVHLHETGLCEGPDFQSAGGHWNPEGKEHGRDNPNGAHLGDLSNLQADANGMVDFSYIAKGVTAGNGRYSIADDDGTALVVHAGPDDYKSDPAGDAGSRVACAILAPAPGAVGDAEPTA